MSCQSQETNANEDQIVTAANEIISQIKYCALITVDSTGHPQARTMETLPLEENFVAWFGTNKNSRKVREVINDPRVSIYYGDPSGNGYVVITGTASIIDDLNEKEKHWLEHWDQFYPDKEATYTLIKIIPNRLEVVSYKHGLTGDTVTWRAPNMKLPVPK